MKLYVLGFTAIVIVAIAGLVIFSSGSGTTENVVSKDFIGAAAPDFTLPSTTGEKVTLSDHKGEHNILLYFQEGVMCPACWTQMVDFENRIADFDKKDIKILTITTDKLYQSKSYAKQIGTNLPLLADEDRSVSRVYDALKDSMHPGERPGHLFVLINKEGNIVWRYSAYNAASGPMAGHHGGTGRMYVPVNEVLDAIGRSL